MTDNQDGAATLNQNSFSMAEHLIGDSCGNWNCVMCTFSNSPSARACSMCNTKRAVVPTAPPPVFSVIKQANPDVETNAFGGPKVFDIDKALDEIDGPSGDDEKGPNNNAETIGDISKDTNNKDAVKKEPDASNTNKSEKDANKKNPGATNLSKGKMPVAPGKRYVKGKGPNNTEKDTKNDEAKSKNSETDKKRSPVKHKADDREEEGMELDLQWVCPKCSSLNQEYFQNCVICNTEKNKDVLEFVQDYWSDKRTKVNTDDDKTTKVAGSKNIKKDDGKEQKGKTTSKTTEEWTCKRCTLKNPSSAQKCSVCETPRTSNIPSADSIPTDIDYSKFVPSPTSPSAQRGKPDGSSFLSVEEDDRKNPSSGKTVPKSEEKPSVDKVMDTWKCSKCSYSKNPLKTENCIVCVAGRKPKENRSQNQNNGSSKTGKLPVIRDEKSDKGKKSPIISPVHNRSGSKEISANKTPKNGKPSSESKEKEMRNQLFWNCPNCSFQNSNAIQSCHVCHTSRKALSVENKHKWICSKCTLLNNNEAVKCSACGNQKGKFNVEKKQKEEAMIVDPHLEPQPSTSKTRSPTASPKPGHISPLKTNGDPAARCSICTYINPHTSGPCQMCGSALTSQQQDTIVSPGTIRPKHSLQRQQSSLMIELRQVEENEALELWQHITLFCKKVLYFFYILE